MRHVGIVIEAISNLKVLGPLLERATQYLQALVIFIPEQRKGKAYDSVTAEIICRAFPHITPPQIVVYTARNLVELAVSRGIEKLVLLNPYRNFVHAVPKVAEQGIEVYGLDYFINSIYVAASYDDPQIIKKSLYALKNRIVASQYWQELEYAVQPEHIRASDRFVSLGTTIGDPFKTLEKDEARHALGIQEIKPIVSVFTPNIRNHQAYFFYGIGTWFALRHVAKLLRAYCDKRGYCLVVKSRQKQWDAHPFITVADNFIDDQPEHIHPSTSALLLGTSKLAVHFGSMMALEAALSGTPTIGFSVEAIDKLHGYMRPSVRALLRHRILEATPGMFHFGKVSQSLSVYASLATFEKVADSMVDSLDYAQKEYEDYNATFSGWQKESLAADRIWSHIHGATATADRH